MVDLLPRAIAHNRPACVGCRGALARRRGAGRGSCATVTQYGHSSADGDTMRDVARLGSLMQAGPSYDHCVTSWLATRGSQLTMGRLNKKRAPPSTDSLSAAMLPPWASMTERQMRRPMPMPLSLVVKKLSNRRGIC